jgi:sulfate/thiosulfate transport system ATP-binding protein
VYDFLGNYNEFDGWKDSDGTIHLAETDVIEVPASPIIRKPQGGKALKLYARPHEMWVTKTPDEREYIQAKVIHINPAGSLIKVELERSGGQLLQVEIPKSLLDQFAIVKGDTLYVRPKQTKVFE